MRWFWVWQIVSMLIELVRLGCRPESDKDLEILLLHRQLAIYERKQERAPLYGAKTYPRMANKPYPNIVEVKSTELILKKLVYSSAS
jgi:hypothetical protein